jgi:hypothetical protein
MELDGNGPSTSDPQSGLPAVTWSTWGLVLSGCATAAMEDGTVHELRTGILFHIPAGPPGHDSWVVGNEPYVSLHFFGADHYAAR